MFAGGLVAGSTGRCRARWPNVWRLGGSRFGRWRGYRDRRLTGIVATTHHQVGSRTDNSERSKGQNSNRQYIAFPSSGGTTVGSSVLNRRGGCRRGTHAELAWRTGRAQTGRASRAANQRGQRIICRSTRRWAAALWYRWQRGNRSTLRARLAAAGNRQRWRGVVRCRITGGTHRRRHPAQRRAELVDRLIAILRHHRQTLHHYRTEIFRIGAPGRPPPAERIIHHPRNSLHRHFASHRVIEHTANGVDIGPCPCCIDPSSEYCSIGA